MSYDTSMFHRPQREAPTLQIDASILQPAELAQLTTAHLCDEPFVWQGKRYIIVALVLAESGEVGHVDLVPVQ